MNSNKFLIGGIVGGILYFLLGYVFYGLLLKNFFNENGMATNMDTIIWWALVAGNIAGGLLLAYILGKANASTAGSGAGIGFVVGLLMGLSFDLMMYSFGKGLTTKGMIADVVVGAVMSAIVGAVIGAILGGKKAAMA